MPERGFEEWTPEQDERLRAALGTLRRDVDAAGLPDVRFVMRRAETRRRRRAVIGIAAGVATVVGLSWAGYQQLAGEDLTVPPPATRTTTDPVTDEPTDGATDAPTDEVTAEPVAPEDLFTSRADQPDTALFVPPSLWASTTFTDGRDTSVGAGERTSSTMFECDPDNVRWGGSDEGVFGIMAVRDAEGFFAAQRVRVLDDPAAASAYVQDLGAAAASCEAPAGADNVMLTVEPLAAEGAYRLTTEFSDGTEPFVTFLHVVQHGGTSEAVSTFTLDDRTGQASDTEALAELERLAGIARGQ